MTDEPASWMSLSGGPCDGQQVWVGPECRAVIVTRDSDRNPWFRHVIDDKDDVWLVAKEAHLYQRVPEGLMHSPRGLTRGYRDAQPVWWLHGA